MVYTQMLNARGGIECDLTVTRLGDESFYIVTGTGYRTHDLDWITRNIDPQRNVTVTDVTREFGVLRALGLERGEVGRVVFIEGMIIAGLTVGAEIGFMDPEVGINVAFASKLARIEDVDERETERQRLVAEVAEEGAVMYMGRGVEEGDVDAIFELSGLTAPATR